MAHIKGLKGSFKTVAKAEEYAKAHWFDCTKIYGGGELRNGKRTICLHIEYKVKELPEGEHKWELLANDADLDTKMVKFVFIDVTDKELAEHGFRMRA